MDRMKRYNLQSLVLMLVISSVVLWLSTALVEDFMLDQTEAILVNSISAASTHHLNKEFFQKMEASHEFEDFYEMIHTRETVGGSLYDQDGRLIQSKGIDLKIAAKDKKPLKKAISGTYSSDIITYRKEVFLDIFIPIREDGEILGVVNIISSIEGQLNNLSRFRNFLMLSIWGGFGLFYVLNLRLLRRAEASRRFSDKMFRGVVESSPDCISVIDMDGRFLYMNPEGLTLNDFKDPNEPIGLLCTVNVKEEHKQKVNEVIEKAKKGEITSLTYASIGQGGAERSWESIIAPIKDERGVIKRIILISRDVTEKKRVEEVIRKSEEKFRTLAEESPNMIFINKGGKVVFANQRYTEVTGYSREEFYSATFDFRSLINSDYLPLVENNFKQHQNGENVPEYEYEILTKNGEIRRVIQSSKLIPYEEGIALLGILTDITSLKEEEERNRFFTEASREGIFALAKGIILDTNTQGARMFGYESPQGMIGRSIFEFVAPTSKGMVRSMIDQRFEGSYEVQSLRKDGTTFTSEVISRNISFKGKNARLSILKDVSDRKKYESELKRNYEAQQAINELLQIGHRENKLDIILQKSLDRILSIPWLSLESKGAIFIVEKKGILSMKAHKSLSKGVLLKCRRVPFGRCICGEAAERGELIFKQKLDDDHTITYKGIADHGHYCIPIIGRKGVLGVINLYLPADHERRSDEESFLIALSEILAGSIERTQAYLDLERAYEELKDLDRLKNDILSNVSHELRTPLTIVSTSLELLREEDDDSTKELLVKMSLRALSRQNQVIDDLTTATRLRKNKKNLILENVDISLLITLVYSKLKPLSIEKSIKIILEIQDDIPEVRTDFAKLEHAFRNILQNAIKFSYQNSEIRVNSYTSDEWLNIQVEDSGIGIPHDKIDKIFDPLYQIDPSSSRSFEGTGMGLTIAKELITMLGGTISVKSTPGKGSLFVIKLPINK